MGSEEDQEEMIEFPEGIELYDQVSADLVADEVTFIVPVPGTRALEGATIIDVCRMRGSWGWTDELRILVMFDGVSAPAFEKSVITDAEISLECASGARLLALDREERIYEWPDDPRCGLEEDDPESRGW